MSGRTGWIDAARGIAVVMIVLMHVTVIVFAPFADDTSTNAAWAAVVNTLWPFHLSTLALLSGMLGARRVRQGVSATAATLTRTAYLYVVWSAVYVLLRTLGVDTWAKPLSMLDIAIGEITAPRTVLWFLLGLVFWTFALAAVHKWPPWLVLTMCAAASIGSYWLPGSRDHDQYIHIISYTVFFALGVYGRELITTIVTKHALAALVTALCLYKALDIVRHIEPRRAALAITDVPWMLSAAIALISASVLLCRVPGIENPLAAIGKRTLPIYVMHVPLAAALLLVPAWLDVVRALGAWTPAIVTTLIVAISLAIFALAMRSPFRVLFEPPGRATSRLG